MAKERTVSAKSLNLARDLRRSMTKSERALWRRVRDGQLGVVVRRQHPIGRYVADFYCPTTKLIIEIDGDVHVLTDRARRDSERAAWLKARGYGVLRVTNKDVLDNMDGVIDRICGTIERLKQT